MVPCSYLLQILIMFFVSRTADGTTFAVTFHNMPADSMDARDNGKDDGVFFSCKSACREQEDSDQNKIPPTLPWCQRGAPYIVTIDRANVAAVSNATELLPVYAIKSDGECDRNVKVFFLEDSQRTAATQDMDAFGYWDGLTVYSHPDASFHFVAIPRPHVGPCLVKFTSVEIFISGSQIASNFYVECPLTRPFWGRTEGYLKGFGVITRARFSMFLDGVNQRVRIPLYALALGAFICAAVALFQPTCPVLIALGLFDAIIAACELWVLFAIHKVDNLVESRLQAHVMGSGLALVGLVLQSAFTIMLHMRCGSHLFNLNIVQTLADFAILGHNALTSYNVEKKWSE